MVAAVAVWDHRPSAGELLGARLGRGWAPTATELIEGDVVLGHAACLRPPTPRGGPGAPERDPGPVDGGAATA
ncbi:hypothetical protein [Aquisphaera giovannonii]|uniref:hypothetical protein n=1 Tax=Aquisphaera giovannonii TaxID=406548 RepID=UPI001AEFA94C|nr:hypothetical protein [Aquisphaera giovannonii]